MKLGKAHQIIADWLEDKCDVFIPQRSNDLKSRIDFLERALEFLRYKNKHLDNKLHFEEFIEGDFSVEGGKVSYKHSENPIVANSGTKPIRLQSKLLLFLLLNHNRSYEVYDIIENFIYNIWDYLTFYDFKKTKTGVTRCFTNTRFAANTLRDYGLLKFTKKEAYKTWTLSLYGFLVAADVLDKDLNWRLSKVYTGYSFDLNPDILTSCDNLKSYDDFVARLKSICKPDRNAEVFKTFNPVLKKAFQLLDGYLLIIQDRRLSAKERRAESLARIKELENLPEIDKFYEEFSSCIYVDDFINKLFDQESSNRAAKI